jgi:Cys-rich peptide (TIGR04165 family)
LFQTTINKIELGNDNLNIVTGVYFMKAEKLSQKCPKCGCTDKDISRKRDTGTNDEAFYIPHIPQGTIGVIRCSECGHLFEYCTNEECLVEIKKISLDKEK